MNLKSLQKMAQDNLVGVVILGLGIVFLLLVLIVAIQTFTGPKDSPQTVNLDESEIEAFQNNQNAAAQNQTASNNNQRKQVRRQTNIRERDIVGAWDTNLPAARALLQIQNGTFRMIIVPRGNPQFREYLNGTYTLIDDLLMLQPDPSIPAPKGASYQILTRAPLPILVSKYKGRMVWQIPTPDIDVYVPNRHAFLDDAKNNIAVWSTLKQ